jgi:hypothetical protein
MINILAVDGLEVTSRQSIELLIMVGEDTFGTIPSSLAHCANILIANLTPPDGLLPAYLTFHCIIDFDNIRKMLIHIRQRLAKSRHCPRLLEYLQRQTII